MVSNKRNVFPPIVMALAIISLGISLWACYVLKVEIGPQDSPVQIKTTWKGLYYKENDET
jgi:xanthine/uracil permease